MGCGNQNFMQPRLKLFFLGKKIVYDLTWNLQSLTLLPVKMNNFSTFQQFFPKFRPSKLDIAVGYRNSRWSAKTI